MVEVLHHSKGPDAGWKVGSGLVVNRRRILTAAHNVGDGTLLVRFLGQDEHPSRLCMLPNGGVACDDVWDLAIIELDVAGSGGAVPELPTIRYARVVDQPQIGMPNVERCWAVGFPRFREKPREPGLSPLRDTARLDGYLPLGEGLVGGLMTFQVTKKPRALPVGQVGESEWQGISGAVVFADEFAVGLITEHHLPEGESALTIVPLVTAIEQLPNATEWWRLLDTDPDGVPALPTFDIPPDVADALRLAVKAMEQGVLLPDAAKDVQVSVFINFLATRKV